jgi:hypothetical protein
MGAFYPLPGWFFGYDIILQAAFAIITLLVSAYSFNIYRLTGQRQSKLFGIAFLSIAVSYIAHVIFSLIVLSKLNESICQALHFITVSQFNTLGIYIYLVFFVAGLVTLTYMTLKIKSKTTFSLITIIILLALWFSTNRVYLFYVISTVLLIYICVFYFRNYLRNKRFKTLIVFIAFFLLLLSTVQFLFAAHYNIYLMLKSTYYITGHFLELLAYLLILINILMVSKK